MRALLLIGLCCFYLAPPWAVVRQKWARVAECRSYRGSEALYLEQCRDQLAEGAWEFLQASVDPERLCHCVWFLGACFIGAVTWRAARWLWRKRWRWTEERRLLDTERASREFVRQWLRGE